MPIGSGLSSQFGFKQEVTYGIKITVDRFVEFTKETLEAEMEYILPMGMGVRRIQRANQLVSNQIGVKGQVEVEVMNKGCGALFDVAIGASTNAQVGVTPEWTQTYACPVTTGLLGKMHTFQIALPDTGGVVRTKTVAGAKVTKATLSAALGGLLKLALDVAGQHLDDTTALAVASFAAGRQPYHYAQGALTIGGVSNVVKSFEFAWDNGLDIDRRGISSLLRREPIAAKFLAITGKMDAEFENLVNLDAFLNGTLAQLVLTFTGGLIPTTANPYKLVLTAPALYFTAETPKVSGPALLRQNLGFEVLWDGTNPPFTLVLSTDDLVP
jgi:hypothetical protein